MEIGLVFAMIGWQLDLLHQHHQLVQLFAWFQLPCIPSAGCHVSLVVPDLLLHGAVLKKAAWILEFKGDGHIYSTVAEAKGEMNLI